MKSSQSKRNNQKDQPEVFYQTSPDRFHMKDSDGNFRDYRKGPASARLGYEFGMSKEEREAFFAHIYKNRVIDCVSEIGGKKNGFTSAWR